MQHRVLHLISVSKYYVDVTCLWVLDHKGFPGRRWVFRLLCKQFSCCVPWGRELMLDASMCTMERAAAA